MNPRRITQTTVVHPLRSEFSFSIVVAPIASADEVAGEQALRELGLEPISEGAISESELLRVLACTLTGELQIFEMADREFRLYANEIGVEYEFLTKASSEPGLGLDAVNPLNPVGSAGPPRTALKDILAFSPRANLCLYNGPVSDHLMSRPESAPVLALHTQDLLILCGNAVILWRALDHGLYARLFEQVTRAPRPLVA